MLRHLYDRLGKIATPREGMADCGTPQQYAQRHAAQMQGKRKAFPYLNVPMPFESTAHPQPCVLGGKWVVFCDCGDAPMASPEWDEARCFNCGAIYRGLPWPDDAVEIESALCSRPHAIVRAWLPHETVADLIAQNLENGIAPKREKR